MGIMDQCDAKSNLIKYVQVSDLYLMVQCFVFALYLKDYWMEKRYVCDNVSV